MKIALNLSPPSSARDRYALAWGIPATLIGVGALILLSRASLREYRDFRAMQHQVTVVESRADDLGRQEEDIRRKLEAPADQDLRTRIRFINKLIVERKVSLAEVSSRLAGLLPEDAHLTSLAFASPKESGQDYAVRMGITAKGEDAIETYINDLEDSPDFKDVSIVNQGFQEDPSQGSQINLVCMARYLPGAEEQAEAKAEKAEASSEKKAPEKRAAHAKAASEKMMPPAKNQKPPQGKPPAPRMGIPNMNMGMKGAQKPTPNR